MSLLTKLYGEVRARQSVFDTDAVSLETSVTLSLKEMEGAWQRWLKGEGACCWVLEASWPELSPELRTKGGMRIAEMSQSQRLGLETRSEGGV